MHLLQKHKISLLFANDISKWNMSFAEQHQTYEANQKEKGMLQLWLRDSYTTSTFFPKSSSFTKFLQFCNYPSLNKFKITKAFESVVTLATQQAILKMGGGRGEMFYVVFTITTFWGWN